MLSINQHTYTHTQTHTHTHSLLFNKHLTFNCVFTPVLPPPPIAPNDSPGIQLYICSAPPCPATPCPIPPAFKLYIWFFFNHFKTKLITQKTLNQPQRSGKKVLRLSLKKRDTSDNKKLKLFTTCKKRQVIINKIKSKK